MYWEKYRFETKIDCYVKDPKFVLKQEGPILMYPAIHLRLNPLKRTNHSDLYNYFHGWGSPSPNN